MGAESSYCRDANIVSDDRRIVRIRHTVEPARSYDFLGYPYGDGGVRDTCMPKIAIMKFTRNILPVMYNIGRAAFSDEKAENFAE